MRRHALILLIVVLVLVAAGCAGRDFSRAQPESLLLGKTTEAEIRQRFGDPYRQGTKLTNGESLKTLAYAYATAVGASVIGDVTPARAQGFYIWNGILVGHDFTSSFNEDKTDFNVAKVQQIKKGDMTEAAVVALLGRPNGLYAYPLVKDKEHRGLVYLYQQTKGTAFNLKFYNQLLVVTIGDGTVKDVELTTSGER